MAGHSKWAQIKRAKGANDSKRSQLFGKLSRLISTQVKLSHGDVNSPAVRAVIEKAKKENMPGDTIERAIQKATEQKDLEPITYEAYGPGGVGIIIEALTDNRNKAAQEVRHILSKNGLSLAGVGSVVWAFEKKDGVWNPTTTVDLSDKDTDALSKLVDELEENDEVQEVLTNAV